MAEKKQKSPGNPAKKTKFEPFDQTHKVSPLKLFITIVTSGQGDAVVKLMEKAGATFSFISAGEGTGRNYLPIFLTGAEIKKQLVFSIVKEEKTEDVCEALRTRFATSKAASGVSMSVKLTSVTGVSVYRFLSNARKVKKGAK